MNIYINGVLTIIESNVAWALPYWQRRKQLRPDVRITWTFGEKS